MNCLGLLSFLVPTARSSYRAGLSKACVISAPAHKISVGFVRPVNGCYHQFQITTRSASSSVWDSLVPKVFRDRRHSATRISEQNRTKIAGWNPATFYIVIFLIIGSNAIQMIALRNSFHTFSRSTEIKLSLLRETIEKVRQGHDVDVKKALGTGDMDQEEEWRQVVEELKAAEAAPATKSNASSTGRLEHESARNSGAYTNLSTKHATNLPTSDSNGIKRQDRRFY